MVSVKKVTNENIDDFVDQWHESLSELPVHEYLGISKEDYGLWVQTGSLPMQRKYKMGDKVVPINKTPRIREHDNCATYYQQQEMSQGFLYIVGFDLDEEKRLNQPCYWCNVVPNMGGDSFAEKDLMPYVEDNKEDENSSTKEKIID